MAVFEYAGLNQYGKSIKGTVEADSIRSARAKLKTQNVYATEIREGSERTKTEARDVRRYLQRDKFSTKELSVFTRQFATLVDAGLPLVSALQALSEQLDQLPAQKKIVLQIKERVEEGSSLAKALGAFPKSFPSLYVNMIASGEESGTLDTVLENLADYLDAQLELRRKVSSSLFYPILMFCFCTLVVIGLLTFVVPSIVEIFKKQGAVLPLPTRILIGISGALTSYWYLLVALLLAVIFGFRHYRSTEKGRSNIDRLLLKAPLVGGLYTKIAATRVSRTLGTLLAGGVSLLTAMDIAKNIVGNVHLQDAIETAAVGVREGRSLAGELNRSGYFPNLLSHMVAVGERSGRLEPMLLKAGKAFENEVNATLSGLTSLIEPVMIIVLGGIVFAIVISILMPMVDLINVVQR